MEVSHKEQLFPKIITIISGFCQQIELNNVRFHRSMRSQRRWLCMFRIWNRLIQMGGDRLTNKSFHLELSYERHMMVLHFKILCVPTIFDSGT